MEALILFSHGSVLCGAGQTLKQHARALRETGDYALVEVGFLNYTEPTFDEAAARCHEAGASQITVVPYFLVPGKFVRVDLPQHIAVAQQRWPELEFRIAPPIGFDESLADALLDLAAAARSCESWREDLHRASDFCEADPQCPLYGTPRCPRAPEGRQGDKETGRQGEGEKGSVGGQGREAAFSRVAPAFMPGNAPPESGSQSAIRNPQSAIGQSEIQNPTSKIALLVLVHGSPRPVANEPMFQVVEVVRRRRVYPIVEVGFMECNEPDIPTGVESCIAQGATAVIAVPYFLHTGNHVADDLPTLLEEAQERHPDVQFRMGDFLGRAPQITDLLLARARAV